MRKVFIPSADMLADKARIEVRGGAGGDGSRVLPARGARPQGRPGRRRRRARRGRASCAATTTCATCSSSSAPATSARSGAGTGRARCTTAPTARRWWSRVPPGTQVERWDGARFDLVARPGGADRPRRARRARQQALRDPTRQAPRLAEKGLPGEEGDVELQLQAARRRRPGRAPERRQVVADRAAHAGAAEGRRLPVHDARAGAGHDRGRRPPARHRRHPGPDRGRVQGAGLGHDFLAHVERCRVLVHVLDLAPLDGSDPEANFALIEAELAAHEPELAALPRIVACPRPTSPRATRRGRDGAGSISSATRPRAWTTSRGGCCGWCPPRRGAGAARGSDVAEFAVFRPAAGRAFGVERRAPASSACPATRSSG